MPNQRPKRCGLKATSISFKHFFLNSQSFAASCTRLSLARYTFCNFKFNESFSAEEKLVKHKENKSLYVFTPPKTNNNDNRNNFHIEINIYPLSIRSTMSSFLFFFLLLNLLILSSDFLALFTGTRTKYSPLKRFFCLLSTSLMKVHDISFQMRNASILLVITFCLAVTVSLSSAQCGCYGTWIQCIGQCIDQAACAYCVSAKEACDDSCGRKRSLSSRLWRSSDHLRQKKHDTKENF